MVGAVVLSPTYGASQEAVVGSAQRIVVGRARAPRDAGVQHCLELFGSLRSYFELEGSARSIIQFEGVLPEAATCVAYAPVDLDGETGVVVDVLPEVYGLIRLAVHLASCLYAKVAVDSDIPLLVRKHTISVLTSDTVRANAAHTTTITPTIFHSFSGDCETTPVSSA